jgi:hypothetical protein
MELDHTEKVANGVSIRYRTAFETLNITAYVNATTLVVAVYMDRCVCDASCASVEILRP